MNDFSETLKLMLETKPPKPIQPAGSMDYKLLNPQDDKTNAPEIADFKPTTKIDSRTTGSTEKKMKQSSGRLGQAYDLIFKQMQGNVSNFAAQMAKYPKRGPAKTGAELAPGASDGEIDTLSGQADAGIQDKLATMRQPEVDPAAMKTFRGKRTRARNAAAATEEV